MRCMCDNEGHAAMWTRGCLHSICDDCYVRQSCPLSMCVGGDSARMDLEERLCRELLEHPPTALMAEPNQPTLFERLASATNPVAVCGDVIYCVRNGAVEPASDTPDTHKGELMFLVGVDFDEGTVLVETRGEYARLRYKVWVREQRMELHGVATPETHEPIPWPGCVVPPWYVYDMDARTVIPVVRIVRVQPPTPEAAHIAQNAEQLRESLETRLKQIEWLRDARMQLALTRERVGRLPAEHAFREQFARWQAMPVEFSLRPHELTAHETRMVEGDELYAATPVRCSGPVRLVDGELVIRGRVLMRFAEQPLALVWDPHTYAVLVTTQGRALFKFYCVRLMCV